MKRNLLGHKASLFLSVLVFVGLQTFAQRWACAEELVARNAEVEGLKGAVTVMNGGTGEAIPAYKGMVLNQDDLIKTGPASTVDIALHSEGEDSEVKIYENSEMTIEELVENKATGADRTTLDLAVGKVLIKAAKLKDESKFEVLTPTSVVGVRGTEFEVIVSAPTEFEIEVGEE